MFASSRRWRNRTGDGQSHSLGSGYLDGIGPRLSEAFIKRGLLLRPLGNIVYFMPPYVITDQEVDWALDQVVEVLQEM